MNPDNPRATDNGGAHNLDYERCHGSFARLSLLDFSLEGLYGTWKKGIPTAPFDITAFDVETYAVDSRAFLEGKYERTFSPGYLHGQEP